MVKLGSNSDSLAPETIFSFILLYSWSLNNMGLKYLGPLIHGFFFLVNSPSYPRVLYPRIHPTIDQKQYFWSAFGDLQIQRADCMHFSPQFYMRDLSICKFSYGGWPEPVLCRYWGTTKVWGMGSEVTCRFCTAWEIRPLVPTLFKGNLYCGPPSRSDVQKNYWGESSKTKLEKGVVADTNAVLIDI